MLIAHTFASTFFVFALVYVYSFISVKIRVRERVVRLAMIGQAFKIRYIMRNEFTHARA